MSIGFPILRLPFLALDNLFKVMNPLEQLLLCRTSKKIKSRIRKVLKKPTFHIRYDDGDRTITFGHGDKKSVIKVELFQRPALKGKMVYNSKKDQTIVYCNDIYSAYNESYNDFIKTFDVQTVVCVHPAAWRAPASDPFNFRIIETKNGEVTTTRSRCRQQSEKIWKKLTIPIPNLPKRLEFQNKNAVWMSLDDAMLTIPSVSIIAIKITNEEMNRFLKSWKHLETVELSHLTLEVHDDFSGQVDIFAIADGLNAVKKDEGSAFFSSFFEITRADGRQGRFYYISTTSVLVFSALPRRV